MALHTFSQFSGCIQKDLIKNPLSGWKIIVLLCITIATSMYERWILHLFRKKLVITIYNSFFKRCSPSIDSSYAKTTHWCILGTKIWNSSWEHHLQWNNQVYSKVTIDFIFSFLLSFFKICLDVATAFFQCFVSQGGTDGLFLHVEKERKAYVFREVCKKEHSH